MKASTQRLAKLLTEIFDFAAVRDSNSKHAWSVGTRVLGLLLDDIAPE